MMDSVRSCERELTGPMPTGVSITRPKVNYLDKELIVGVGEYKIVSAPLELMCIGLGSCVGIAIWDSRIELGGVAHAMLPAYDEGKDKVNASKYADSATFLMVDEMVEMGASRSNLKAKMAGGAQMFSFSNNDTLNIGQRNGESAKAALKKERIPLLAEELGGNKGRTIFFTPKDGAMRIQKGSEITHL
jgi:chemotaxis protein CheD